MLVRVALVLALVVSLPSTAIAQLCGRLDDVDGTKVLYLWGTAEQRGFAEGYLMAQPILGSVDDFVMRLIPSPVLWDRQVVPRAKQRFRFADRDRQWARGVLRGIRARRSLHVPKLRRDMTLDDVLVCSCIPDLMGLACSSFAAWGELVPKDTLVVGRNLDYASSPSMMKSTVIKVHAREGDRAAWVGVGWAGFGGCLTGVNEHGVWLAIHDVFVRAEPDRRKFTSRVHALASLITSLRPGADTATRAAAALREHRFAVGCNAMLAWHGEGGTGAVVLEFDGRRSSSRGVTVRRPQTGQSFVACSNHHRLRSDRGHRCARFAALAAKAGEQPGSIDVAAAWRHIKETSVRRTIYRCVADLGRGVLQVDRRLVPKRDVWAKRLKLETRAQFDEAAQLAVAKPLYW